MPALVTLATLRTMVRELADMETATPTSHFVDDTELTSRINDALKQLYDKLILANGQEYYATSSPAALFVADTSAYTLPTGAGGTPPFYRLLGMRVTDGTRWADVPTWSQRDRVMLLNRTLTGGITIYEYRYRLQAQTVVVLPIPQTAHQYVLDYVPAFVPLSLVGDTFDGVNGWERWAALTSAIDLANKEEADPSGLVAQRAVIDEQIQRLAGSRDQGRPERVQDARQDGRTRLRPYVWGTTV